MAFFKFRKDGDEHTTPSPAPESVEAMRKRAKYRLIGAAVLVAVGVVGFPLLFDNQPRPIPVDLPITIPDKNTVKPLGNLPVGDAATGCKIIDETAVPEASAPAISAPSVAPLAAKPEMATKPAAPTPAPAASRTAVGTLGNTPVVAPAKPAPKPAEKPVERAKPEVPAKPLPAKPDTAKADGSKAQSLLEGKESFVPSSAPSSSTPSSAPAGAVRYVVQVGAFSDVIKAREARIKLESAGLKTYTQVVTPKEGKRIRVRVGPFESKAEADKAAAKVKKLDLPAAILEL
jgi:DedD protein